MILYGIVNIDSKYTDREDVGNLVDDWGNEHEYGWNRICTPIYTSLKNALLEIEEDQEKYLGDHPQPVKITIEYL